nr:unnamed protein product [Callosobruchus analis]
MDFVGKCDRRTHPKAKATCWISRIFFIYTIGLIRHTSRKEKIGYEDILEVLPEHSSRMLRDMMENKCKQELDRLGTISVYKLLWTCFGKEYVLTGLLQLFMRTLVVVTIPWTISQLINYFQPNQSHLTKFDAYYLAALLIFLNFLNITYLHNYLLHLTSMGIRIRTSFCALIYRKCLRLTAESLSKVSVGNIVTLMTKDVAAFETMIIYANDVWIGFVQTAVIFYLLYLKVGVAAFVGVGLFLIVIPIQVYIGKVVSKLRVRSANNTDKRLQTIRDAVASVRIIKMYNWECVFEEKISHNRRIEVNTLVKIFIRKTVILLLGALTSKLAFFAMVITYIWLGNPVSAELVYFILALLQRVRHAFNVVIPMGITESAELYASAKRIEILLNAESVSTNAVKENNLSRINESSRVWIKNATVEINGQQLLREITFDIGSGLTIVSGPIGSGKTTILRLLLNEIRCKEGTVHVIGRVSYAPQESWIFPSTLKQNILLGEKFDRNRYEEVMKVCALTVDRDRLPGGDDFILKEQGSNISSGQKARINLARAIYRNADLYLLDDCLRSLDIHVQEYVFKECMLRFLNEKICIFVTQNHHFLDKVDSILWVENGAVLKKSPDTVRTKNEHIEEPLMNEMCDVTLGDYDEVNESTKLLEPKHKPEIYCEDRKAGRVKTRVYNRYISLGGGYFLSVFIVLFFIATHTCKSYSEKMVSNWVNLEENMSLYKTINITVSDDFNTVYNFTLMLYSCLILGTVVLSVISAIILFNFTRTASNKLHNLMVRSMMGAVMYFHDITPIGDIINRFSKDLTIIDEQLPFVVYDLLEILLSFCGVVILLTYINLLFLIPVTVLVTIMCLMRQIYIPAGRNLQRLDTAYITVGDVGLALTQAYTLTGFVQYGIRQWAEMENKMTSVERALEYTKAEQESRNTGILPTLNWPLKGKIQFVDVCLRYCSSDSYLLKHLDFIVNPKEKIGIVGRTGAGKSTLISTLFRLYDYEGEILIDGLDIKTLQLATVRQKITIIPQEPVVFKGSIRDHLDPFRSYNDHEIWSALEKSGLLRQMSGRNITSSLNITSHDINLTDGQKQLLSIARAILVKNKIIILDELTANMDEDTERLVSDLVMQNFESCTVIIVAHKLETVIGLDKVMVLEHGAIVEYNTPAKLLEDRNGVFYSMVKRSELLA